MIHIHDRISCKIELFTFLIEINAMKLTTKIILTGLLFTTLTYPAMASPQRVVAITPDVAEITVALGEAKKLVGIPMYFEDKQVKNAKVVGMHRNISPENVLEVKPDLVMGSYMTPSQTIFEQLKNAGIPAYNVMPKEDLTSFYQGILKIGELLGSKNTQTLADKWKSGMGQYMSTGKRYILSYNGTIVAGKNTVGDVLIKHAGGINAASMIDGFKPMAKEAWLAAKPDIIIIAEHHKGFTGDAKKVATRPELTGSNAAKNLDIYFWNANDYLRFGLNSPKMIDRLHDLAK